MARFLSGAPTDHDIAAQVELLRTMALKRRKQAIVGLVLLCAITVAYIVSSLWLQNRTAALEVGRDWSAETISMESMHAMVWHVFDLSMLRDRLLLKLVLWGWFFSMGIWTFLSQLAKQREEKMIVALWDRISALESQVQRLRNGAH